MSWRKKKADPISARAKALDAEIAALEAQIKRLDATLQQSPAQPRLRSTAVPHGATVTHTPAPVEPAPAAPAPPPPPRSHEPIFEEVGQEPLKPRAEPGVTSEHFNELGVRKYDFTALVRRVQNLFHRPAPANPRLVNYLAAGGVQGLQPLRKEKRVARNRFIALVIFLFLLLLGIISVFVRNR